MEGLLIFFIILFVYFLIVFILKKTGTLEKHNISFYGPALLFRTKKGRNFLKKIASKKRFWKAYGSFGIVFCFICMIIMVIFFLWNFTTLLGLDLTPAEKAGLPGPEFALILPGINPILPLEYFVYIIIALIIAIVVHEFSHGILTYASDLKVKSMGILYFIIPIGAFVEPDEEKLKKTKISKRMRVFAVGPLANFVVVLISLFLFSFVFMSSLQPVTDGVVIISTSEDAPADIYGFEPGMIITSINGTPIQTYNDFFIIMNGTEAGEEIEVGYYWQGHNSKPVNLSDKYEEYEKRWPSVNNDSYKGKGYFGIGPFSHNISLAVLKNPFGYNPMARFAFLLTLPVMGYIDGYNPIVYPFTESYEITGPLSVLPKPVFWGIANALYWIFWLNLLVGLFNVLPMVPLDGGFLFNDSIRALVKRIKREIPDEKVDKIVRNVSLVVSLTILFLVLFPMFFKYI
jgi:membrane-associated protease RseP (regulator of RpoE activity)